MRKFLLVAVIFFILILGKIWFSQFYGNYTESAIIKQLKTKLSGIATDIGNIKVINKNNSQFEVIISGLQLDFPTSNISQAYLPRTIIKLELSLVPVGYSLTSIEIIGPELRLDRAAKKAAAVDLSLIWPPCKITASDITLVEKENVLIKDARLDIQKDGHDAFFVVSGESANKPFIIEGKATREDKISLKGHFEEVNSQIFGSQNFTLFASGEFEGEIAGADRFKLLVKAQDLYGTYQNTKTHHITAGRFNLGYTPKSLEVRDIELNLEQEKLIATVDIEKGQITVQGEIESLEVEKVCEYWPTSLLKNARTWYCNALKSGKINNNSFIIKSNKDKIEYFQIRGNLEKVRGKFYPTLKEVTDIEGELEINPDLIKVNINNAKAGSLMIKQSELRYIDFLSPVLSLRLHILGKLSQMQKIAQELNIPPVSKAIKFTDGLEGEVESHLSLAIPLGQPGARTMFDFSGEAHALWASDIIDTAPLDSGEFSFNINNYIVNIRGRGQVDHKETLVNIEHDILENRSSYQVWGEIIVAQIESILPSELIDVVEQIEKVVGLKKEHLRYTYSSRHFRGATNINVKGEIIENNKLETHKSILAKSNMEAVIHLQGLESRYKFAAANSNLQLYVEGIKSSETKGYKGMLWLLRERFSAEFKSEKDAREIKINAEKVGLEKINEILNKAELPQAKGKEKTRISGKVKELTIFNREAIHGLEIDFLLGASGCAGSLVTGKLSDNSDITLKCTPVGIELYAGNAGLLLHGLKASDSVVGGDLSLYISSKRTENDELQGVLSLKKFYVRETPMLAQIFTLFSIKGILNTLSDQGVYFFRMNAPFSYKDGTINIQESWTEGADLGISVKGSLNLTDNKLSLLGHIVPLYSLNRAISSIPLIGRLLTANKSRGVLAIDYSLTGELNRPQLQVNPMSILLPQIMRPSSNIPQGENK